RTTCLEIHAGYFMSPPRLTIRISLMKVINKVKYCGESFLMKLYYQCVNVVWLVGYCLLSTR
ncbi:MAG TPA: hypothetical protein PLJ73_05490, partial [Myxococcota bacterium]|nr:hypothetical protein [Myxococcota bacterium]